MVGIVHTDIIKSAGVDPETIPGFKQSIVFALASEVDTVPALPANPSTNTERVTIDDDMSMKSGKSSFTVQGELKMSKLGVELVGAPGSRLYKHTFTFRLTGTSVDAEAFGRMSKNGDYYVIPTGMDDVKRFLGIPDFPCKVELAAGSMGEAPEDEDGVYTEYNVTAYSVTPFPPRFTGDVVEGSGS